MSTHNICFHGEIKIYLHFLVKKKVPYLELCDLSKQFAQVCPNT